MGARINFIVSEEDAVLIDKIVERTQQMWPEEIDAQSCAMDLTATHANGCPLQLQRLLDADDFIFAHDVSGIMHHLHRSSGKLVNNFEPHCVV
ncbi:MAG: hypothetical protein HQM04_06620 [Magnetococcales bacterium]|nr:hypothetical protein [Magnetococcales bacterium]MBF0114700.1 hypothetical protein [Magnetococcales bacterium]